MKGYLYQRASGGKWYLRYSVAGKRVIVCTNKTAKKDAEEERDKILEPFQMSDKAEVLRTFTARLADVETQIERLNQEKTPPPKIPEVWQQFLDSPLRPDPGDSTLRVYRFKWNRFVDWLSVNHAGVAYLSEVTPAMAAQYAKKLATAKMSASTFNQHRNLLRMVWRVLADDCRLSSNPWDKIHPRKLTPLATRKRALTPVQFENLIAAVNNEQDLKDLFTLLAWTGLRLADAVLMQWGAVDFSHRVITLAPIKTARRQGKLVHIPIFPAALDVLNQRQSGKVLDPQGFVFPKLAAVYRHDVTIISKAISDAFDKAGIKTTEKRAERSRAVVVYGAHSLRHFFVTAATSAGMPAAMIKSITGHATDSMLEHYQQIGVELAADLAGRIQGAGTALLVDAASASPNDFGTILARIRAIAEAMTPNTWEGAREELLVLTKS